ncbi:MAG: hypothetical protein Q8T04_04490 [Bacteroidota bacterium]|nr:hypothetical protein [Bacteroidota bacterium]
MELTNLQKNIINSIIKNEVYDVLTFIYKFLDYTPHDETIKILKAKDEKRFSGMEGHLIILNDFETSFNALKEYIALVEKLKKEFLVIEFLKDDYEYQSYNAKFLKFPTMLIQKQEKIDQPVETHTLAYQYGVKYIIPSPDLEDFKSRGYKTLEEKRFELEVKDRKTAMNWTKAIALLSIFGVLFSTLFNFFTSRNERIVEIKSVPKTDTIKAYILSNSLIDSTVNKVKLLPKSKTDVQN